VSQVEISKFENLKEIKPSIKSLYFNGDVDLLNSDKLLAIVGSRRVTDYGRRVIESWMPILVNAGITVVSGFMYGVDQIAHKAALDSGGKTIAVLGWGIDYEVPKYDIDLYRNILDKNSLIVSEYEGNRSPEKWMFPQRNRIVAGVSIWTLVVEAAPKSGSLITARLANKMRKVVMALPGEVNHEGSKGTNNLIKQNQAKMVTCAEDVIENLGLTNGQMKLISGKEQVYGKSILELLKYEPMTVDEMARLLKINTQEILSQLFELNIGGLIEEKDGKYFLNKPV